VVGQQVKPYYDHAGITIYHGDCFETLPKLGMWDLTLTDPPYGVGFADWDKAVPSKEWLEVCLLRSALTIITPGNRNHYDYPKPKWTLCWFRPGSTQRADGGGFSHWEPVLVYGGNPFAFDAKEFNPQTGEANSGHPCTKPMSVWKWLISGGLGDKDACTIVDPFVGSGTTLVAAKDMGHRAIGIEIEERYCEIAAKRLSQEVFEFGK
jgi:site-specific DNA-methyltransferase (adenine-specific)